MKLLIPLALVLAIIIFAPWLIQASISGIVVLLFLVIGWAVRFLILAIAIAPAYWLLRRIVR